MCVSRPRRFGKSVDANMLVAYYGKDCDSHSLFDDLKISQYDSYKKHLNQHHVIYLNMHNFLTVNASIKDMIQDINDSILEELREIYPTLDFSSLAKFLAKVYSKTKEGYIFIIDEWDCVFRVYQDNKDIQKEYLD